MPAALVGVTDLAVALYLSSVALLAALIGAVGWSLHRLHRRVGLPLWLAVPLAWTAGEWVRAHLPGGLAFPWLGLGTSLTGFPELVGVAELVGARGVTFWLALSAGLAAELVVRSREGRRRGAAALSLALVLAIPAGWGVWRAASLELRDAGRVAVVRTEVPRDLRTDARRAVDTTTAQLASLVPEPAAGELDLVVWPETAFPVRFGGPDGEEARRFARSVSRRLGAAVLVGAYGSSGPEGRRHNSAFLVDSAGPTGFVYHKRFLVPVVERAPPLPGGGVGPDRWGGLAPGASWPTGPLGRGLRFGVLVCYESAFPEAARAYARRGADLLVNVTNDDWFGGTFRQAPTAGPRQHSAHLVMRSVENRIPAARSANGGIAMVVDPVGRIHAAASVRAPGLRVAPIRTADVDTLYSRIGDVAGIGSAAATLLLLLAGSARRVLIS